MRLLTSLLIVLAASMAWAGDFYVLDMDDVLLQSQKGEDTIRIKKEMRDQYGIELRKKQLLSVMMVSKTRAGKGTAQLIVGEHETKEKRVKGGAPAWSHTGEKSFDRTLFKNPTRSSEGAWQIHLNGNFKVRQLVVEIANKNKREVTLNYNHQKIEATNGDVATLHLRSKSLDAGIDTRRYDLISATLVAKSRRGRGKASLLVDDRASADQSIGGQPELFASSGDYYRQTFKNPQADSEGVWQIKLRGRLKVKSVILKLREK